MLITVFTSALILCASVTTPSRLSIMLFTDCINSKVPFTSRPEVCRGEAMTNYLHTYVRSINRYILLSSTGNYAFHANVSVILASYVPVDVVVAGHRTLAAY